MKKKKRLGASKPKAKKHRGGDGAEFAPFELSDRTTLLFSFVLATAIVVGGFVASATDAFYSSVERRPHILFRTIFCFMAQAAFSEVFASAFRLLTRWTMDAGPERGAALEITNHDASIVWPKVEVSYRYPLPASYRSAGHKSNTQPFFLNRARAAQRKLDAFTRIGMAAGSTSAVWFTGALLDKRDFASLGLDFSSSSALIAFATDLGLGVGVGGAIVSIVFLLEWWLGWVHVLGFMEVFDLRERFAVAFGWELVFHCAVAINEEIPVRGWLLLNMADAICAYMHVSVLSSVVFAMLLQSCLFVALHLGSPGGTQLLSMANIFIGGLAGGLNVLVTGSMAFALGWHFGWNIFMGNVLGLSTSGIPVSCAMVSVVPHPAKARLHGGVFGLEGGVLCPAAYLLGILLLVVCYGIPDHFSLVQCLTLLDR